jgi:hypothetical protein
MSKELDELTSLNRDYVASVQNCDVKRFDQILGAEFYCTNPDKSFVDRAGFLQQTALPVTIKGLVATDVKIRIMGDFAIIHGATSYTTADGRPLHRLLGQAKRPLARGVGACVAVTPASSPPSLGRQCSCIAASPHASNMMTLRTVLPAFIAAKPSLISDSFSLAEIQSSRCSLPRM